MAAQFLKGGTARPCRVFDVEKAHSGVPLRVFNVERPLVNSSSHNKYNPADSRILLGEKADDGSEDSRTAVQE
jgi:hypothetical protein